MTANIPQLQSACNFFMNIILICSTLSKGFITYHYVATLSWILILRQAIFLVFSTFTSKPVSLLVVTKLLC
jgi:hypothetical protein